MEQQAQAIAAAWHDPGRRLAGWPGTMPPDTATAYALQRMVAERLGPVGGWKVGAPVPDAPPSCAPMPLSGISPAPARLSLQRFPQAQVESEISLCLGADLPPRAEPYSEAEVMAAVATCHPALEILQSRFLDEAALSPAARLADLLGHAAFVHAEPIAAWRGLDFAALGVTQQVSGQPPVGGRGNPAGAMPRLLCWLANTGARALGGLRAGQFVTCGSWTGKTAIAGPAEVETRFEHAPVLRVRFVTQAPDSAA